MANNTTGLTRIIKAAGYSWKGFRAAWVNEAAFRQEAVAAIVAVVIACFLDVDAITRVLLIGSVLLVMIVEILNSAIEAESGRNSMNCLAGRKTWVPLPYCWRLSLRRSPGSRCFGRISDEPRGIIKSLVFCAVFGSKIAFDCIYSQHNCIYTQGAV